MNEQRVSLQEVLEEIATGVLPVDLSVRVAHRARLLRRRRAAVGGAAAVGMIGAASVAAVQLTASRDVAVTVGGSPGAAPTPAQHSGWYAYTPLASPGGSVLAYGSTTAVAPPSATVLGATAPCPTFDDFTDGKVTAAQKTRATAMGTYLCSALGGGAKFGQVEEWVSTGGLSGGGTGLTYDIQAHHPGAGAGNPTEQGEVWLSISQHSPVAGAAAVSVTADQGVLSAIWPDGTTVLMTAGKDTPANRAILADPVFDAFAQP